MKGYLLKKNSDIEDVGGQSPRAGDSIPSVKYFVIFQLASSSSPRHRSWRANDNRCNKFKKHSRGYIGGGGYR